MLIEYKSALLSKHTFLNTEFILRPLGTYGLGGVDDVGMNW